MKIKNVFRIIILAVMFATAGCQSLEDTYDKYAGDGKIRYVGKCEDFKIEAGWKRFVLSWTKSPDPRVKQIKIVWKTDNDEGSYTVSADQVSFETEATFEDMPYTFECYGMDEKGNLSLPVTQYGRPFTPTHEMVIGFPKMVNKHFFLDDHLIIFLDSYIEGMESTTLTYYQGRQPQTIEVTAEMFDDKFLYLTNVDRDRDVVVDRIAEVEGCIDPIVFDSYALDRDQVLLNLDFAQQIKDHYNLEEVTPKFIRSLETLEIDYSVKSFEDILYFTNLKKVVLGANRFMVQAPDDYMILSELEDYEASIYAFEKMRGIAGIEVEIHNDHFELLEDLDFAVGKGNPELPVLDYLDTTGWTVTSSSKEGEGDVDPAHPERILDNDPSTLWAPENKESLIRTHELTIDMKSIMTLSGFKVTQALKNNIGQDYYPDIIHIQVSKDGYDWEEGFNQIQSHIGINYGESTVLRMPQQMEARYIKIILADKIYLRNNTCLGDFMPF